MAPARAALRDGDLRADIKGCDHFGSVLGTLPDIDALSVRTDHIGSFRERRCRAGRRCGLGRCCGIGSRFLVCQETGHDISASCFIGDMTPFALDAIHLNLGSVGDFSHDAVGCACTFADTDRCAVAAEHIGCFRLLGSIFSRSRRDGRLCRREKARHDIAFTAVNHQFIHQPVAGIHVGHILSVDMMVVPVRPQRIAGSAEKAPQLLGGGCGASKVYNPNRQHSFIPGTCWRGTWQRCRDARSARAVCRRRSLSLSCQQPPTGRSGFP